MRQLTLTILLMLTVLTSTHAQQRQDPPWLKEFVAKRIVYEVPGMAAVRVKKDLVYKRAETEQLRMDVYSPRAQRRPVPAVLFIHGGRVPPNLLTTPKDWAVYVSFGQLMAASGFVGVTFNHRFYKWESLADAQSDVMDAIEYVRDHAATLGVDPERIVLWSVSAGGIFLSQPLRDLPSYMKAIVAYYSELDLQNERASAPASVSDETLKRFSPVHYLEELANRTTTRPSTVALPPMFIARAGLDDKSLNDGLDRFVQAALKNNATLQLYNHATGHHGFDIQDDNERSREILKQTVEFLKTQVRL